MMIFLSEEDTPLDPELFLSLLREGSATGVEVVVIKLATVCPSLVAYEVMVFTTGVWVVVGAVVVLLLSELVVVAPLPLVVVGAGVDSEIVSAGVLEEEEDEDVVGLAEVVVGSVVVGAVVVGS